MSELEEIKKLARDAVSALRYIEQTYGRLYGVGWDGVFESAKAHLCEEPRPVETEPKSPEVHPDLELSDTYWEAYHASRIRKNEICHYAALRAVVDKHGHLTPEPIEGELTDLELLTIARVLPVYPDGDDIISVLRAAISADRSRFRNFEQT